jgi:hypothetical protein
LVKVDGIMKGLEAGTAQWVNCWMMMHYITTCPKLQRVRVIAARCETSSQIC